MGWTTPTDRATGYTPSSTDWNIIEDDLTFLYGDTGWTNVSTFTNSWANFSTYTTRFRLIGNLVVIDGAVTGGTIGSPAFTLPAGYRPTQTQNFAAASNSLFGYFSVNTTGTVVPVAGSNVWFTLDCSFAVI